VQNVSHSYFRRTYAQKSKMAHFNPAHLDYSCTLKSQSPEGQNPHGISIESLCSKPNQQQIEMLTQYAEERGMVFPKTMYFTG